MAFEYGDDLVGFAKAESTFMTPISPAAGDAFRARQIALAPAGYDRTDPGDRRGTYSVINRIEGRHWATWSTTQLFRPSESLGVVPDMGPFLKGLLGTETINASTSVVYTQLKDRSALSMAIWAALSSTHLFVRGAVVQQCRIQWSGSDYIIFEFSGIAGEYGETGSTTTNGTGSSATALVLTDADFVSEGSRLSIGGNNNSGSGYGVTAVNYTTETATITPAATWSNGAAVIPYLPTATTLGIPIFGTAGTVSWDNGSTSIEVLSGDLTISTGMDLHNQVFGTSRPNAVIMAGKWNIAGNLTLAVNPAEFYLYSHARRQVQKDFKITLGGTAAKKMVIDMNVVEINPAPISVPDTGLATTSISYNALGTSGEDNITLTLN